MLLRIPVASIVMALCVLPALAESGDEKSNRSIYADLVFHNGDVYTVDGARSWAQAVAVRDGRIVFVGADIGVKSHIGDKTRVIDLQGRMLLPGFHDSHVHLVGGGIELSECDLNGLTDLSQILQAVKRFAEKNPSKKWIRGGGWPLTLFEGNPPKEVLDQIVPDRPVILDAFDGHSTWANSMALKIAGIDRETPDPPRGRIERNSDNGEPTGTLRESASKLVINKIPPYRHEEFVDGLRRGLAMANRFGITSIQEASVREPHLDAFVELDKLDELTVRAVGALRVEPEKGLAQVAQLTEMRSKTKCRRFRPTAIKIFLDGVIESRTAALLEPYLNRQEKNRQDSERKDRGWLDFEPEELKPLIVALDRQAFQIHIHAIGDRAIQSALDAFELARSQNGIRDSRHHLAHIELFAPQDLTRLRRLGVIANFQALWASADDYITKMTEPVLGPERSRWLYPIHSVAESGAIIVGGSDWSVSSMNPLDAIQVAITRRGVDEGPGPAWRPEELVDLPLMLAAYTINGAYVNFQEKETGSIEVGKAADLIVLDQNLFEMPKHKIHEAKVLLTLLEGKVVYRAASMPGP